MNFSAFLTVFLTLFAVIDIIGSIPVVIDMRARYGELESLKATAFAGILMFSFLFFGNLFLDMLGLDVESFAIAGSIVIFIIGLEMVLGINIFKSNPNSNSSYSITPLAFPIIAGAGSLTTILSLKADYSTQVIMLAILLNLTIVFGVLKATKFLEVRLSPSALEILRRIFGVVLIAISIKMFKSNISFIV